MNWIASRHETSAKPTRNARCPTSAQPSNAEDRVADELDAVVERVEVAERPAPTRAARRAGRTCRRRGTSASAGRSASRRSSRSSSTWPAMKMPKHAQPKPDSAAMNGDEQHPPARVEAEDHRDEHRHAAVDADPRGDPQRLAGDELLGVDRRGEDRVVGVLELVLDEGRVHRREGAREEHGRGDDPGADEVDVVVAGDGR